MAGNSLADEPRWWLKLRWCAIRLSPPELAQYGRRAPSFLFHHLSLNPRFVSARLKATASKAAMATARQPSRRWRQGRGATTSDGGRSTKTGNGNSALKSRLRPPVPIGRNNPCKPTLASREGHSEFGKSMWQTHEFIRRVGTALRTRKDDLTQEPLPERWVDLNSLLG